MIQIWSFCAGRKTSCSGIFAYVCTEKLAFVDYLRTAQKNPFVQDWSLCVDTQKATSSFFWIISAHAKFEFLRL